MNLKAPLAAIVLAAALAAGPAALAAVSIVQTPSAALAPGSSYAWAPVWGVAVGSPAPAVVNEITAQQLQAVTDAVLSEKGYRRVDDPADADLVVTYGVITAPRADAKLDGRAPRGPWFDGPSDYSLGVSQKTRGTLVLDLTERRTGRLVYRATSEKDISSKDAQPKRLNSVLKEMTKRLPMP